MNQMPRNDFVPQRHSSNFSFYHIKGFKYRKYYAKMSLANRLRSQSTEPVSFLQTDLEF